MNYFFGGGEAGHLKDNFLDVVCGKRFAEFLHGGNLPLGYIGEDLVDLEYFV
jgi:hypothetical protein